MHCISKYPFTRDMFSIEHLKEDSLDLVDDTIAMLNKYRDIYLASDRKDKDAWWQMIQLLPSTFNQKRTWTGNYANLRNMYFQRRNHKLDEWHTFCDEIKKLPYAEDLITWEPDNN